MKKSLVALAVLTTLVGCSSTNVARKPNDPIPSPTPVVKEEQKVAAQGKVEAPISIKIPPWYIKAPASTDEYIWVTGTAISSSLSMSRSKAMLDAQVMLADKLNGMIDSVVRQSIKDNNAQVVQDYTSKVVRKKIVDTSLAGHHLEDSTIQPENKGYRTFVLVRYPIGDANKFLKDRLGNGFDIRNDADIDKELDKVVTPKPPVSTSSQTSSNSVEFKSAADSKLLDVENPEYRRRRAEVLKDPNAVVGTVTVR